MRSTRLALAALISSATAAAPRAGAQPAAQPAPPRTVLAIGAHAGDVELTAGTRLLEAGQQGARVVLLHLTFGEGGNPRPSADAYGAQKRREVEEVARALGAEVPFGPWRDGELPDDAEARRWIADAIRRVKPTLAGTHWRESIHEDHAPAHAVVKDAVLLASLDGYSALATVRGAKARRAQAVAFDVDPLGKRRVLDGVP